MIRFTALLAAAVLTGSLGTACSGCEPPGGGDDEADAGVDDEADAGLPPPPFAISTKNRLAWKRQRAVESDFMAALSLDKGSLCNELGLYSCVDFVHLVPLGGNEPFAKSQYEPLPTPTVTTSIALDRLALSACTTRADLDAAGPAVVFTSLDLASGTVRDADADATAAELGRRLLARDLLPAEIEALRDLTVDDDGAAVGARDYAILSCFALGTMTETLFY